MLHSFPFSVWCTATYRMLETSSLSKGTLLLLTRTRSVLGLFALALTFTLMRALTIAIAVALTIVVAITLPLAVACSSPHATLALALPLAVSLMRALTVTVAIALPLALPLAVALIIALTLVLAHHLTSTLALITSPSFLLLDPKLACKEATSRGLGLSWPKPAGAF
jgi:hypothetical protein